MRIGKPIALILLIPLIALLLFSVANLEVVVIEVEGDTILLRAPATIAIEYLHSVERSKVVEVLEIKGGCVYLARILWQGYGAGMPSSTVDIPDGRVKIVNGMYEGSMGKCLGSTITVNLDYMVEGKVVVGGKTISRGIVKVTVVRGGLLDIIGFYLRYYVGDCTR